MKKWANLKSHQFFLDHLEKGGHRANCCPKTWRDRQEDTENLTDWNKNSSMNQCWKNLNYNKQITVDNSRGRKRLLFGIYSRAFSSSSQGLGSREIILPESNILDFFSQSLTNLREVKYSTPVPFSLPYVEMKANKFSLFQAFCPT